MKKTMILVCALICANQMYGMEPIGRYGLGGLPPEIQVMLIQYFQNYNKLNDIIKAIKATSLVDKELNEIINNEYGNQKGFTKLVHILANKFNISTMEVAEQFHTPAAQKYLELAKQLRTRLSNDIWAWELLSLTEQLIKDGLDPDYSWPNKKLNTETWSWDYKNTSFLEEVCELTITSASFGNYVPVIELLLKNGAKPNNDIITMLSKSIKIYYNEPIEERSETDEPWQQEEALKLINQYAKK